MFHVISETLLDNMGRLVHHNTQLPGVIILLQRLYLYYLSRQMIFHGIFHSFSKTGIVDNSKRIDLKKKWGMCSAIYLNKQQS